jgi:hypothetical protein
MFKTSKTNRKEMTGGVMKKNNMLTVVDLANEKTIKEWALIFDYKYYLHL